MRWPAAWADPATLELLKGTGIDTLLIDNSDEFDPVADARRTDRVCRSCIRTRRPTGVANRQGRMAGRAVCPRRRRTSSAGPTGVPWVDSNGWAVRLAAALHPDCACWIDAAPPKQAFPSSYLTAIADTAAYGGRWIVSLDDALAARNRARECERAGARGRRSGRRPRSSRRTRTGMRTRRPRRSESSPSFTGDNEFFSHELLNLLARAGQHYLVLREGVADGRRRCADCARSSTPTPSAPSPALRKELTAFVEAAEC